MFQTPPKMRKKGMFFIHLISSSLSHLISKAPVPISEQEDEEAEGVVPEARQGELVFN